MKIAGIDRWRGGWIIAEIESDQLVFWAAAHIAEACERLAEHAVVAIDMPIALAVTGTRSAESQVRSVLGSSARSVFTSPTRRAVEAETQNQATEWNRSNEGPGISAQSFGLFASIRELRGALHGPGSNHWWETHPETAFALMNDGDPLGSKRSALGVAQRLVHLRPHFPTLEDSMLSAPPKVPVDDVLDAAAALWSARRISSGEATVYGPAGRDDEGFAMGIRI